MLLDYYQMVYAAPAPDLVVATYFKMYIYAQIRRN